jgi:hypothetical protein
MSACLVFVFAGLLEYALVNVIARKGELKQQVRFSKEVSEAVNFADRYVWIVELHRIALHCIATALIGISFYRKKARTDQRN